MVHKSEVERQLRQAGYSFRFWWRAERRELGNVLMPDETIAHCVNGQYEGGLAILCVTDHRILLIDRKPMYLTLEDIRFDMVAEIDYRHRLLNAAVHITTPNRTLIFVGWNHAHMRQLMNYAQRRLIELRQLYMLQQFQPANPESQANPAQAVGQTAIPGTLAYEATPIQMPATGFRGRPAVNPYTAVPILSHHRISKFNR